MTINQTIKNNSGNVLNVYCTAGYPLLDSTVPVIKALADNGVDLIELGMPYSDPLADGPTIQGSSERALANGMTLDILFSQVEEVRQHTSAPIIAMGYYNQLLQYGVERFLCQCQKVKIQGLIIPDLPMDIYEAEYLKLFSKYNIEISFLITPLTSDDRIIQAAKLSSAFLYVVSQTSITGNKNDIQDQQKKYFNKIKNMQLLSPSLIGFGIHDRQTYDIACSHSDGAIIGSAFIRAIDENNLSGSISTFIQSIKG